MKESDDGAAARLSHAGAVTRGGCAGCVQANATQAMHALPAAAGAAGKLGLFERLKKLRATNPPIGASTHLGEGCRHGCNQRLRQQAGAQGSGTASKRSCCWERHNGCTSHCAQPDCLGAGVRGNTVRPSHWRNLYFPRATGDQNHNPGCSATTATAARQAGYASTDHRRCILCRRQPVLGRAHN